MPDQVSRAADFNSDPKWNASHQPPPFRATGLGLQNFRPDKPATQHSASGVLMNPTAKAVQEDLKKLYMYVTEVETGWSLQGESSQSVYAKTFYPKNLRQNELTIVAQMPNQYEYDKAVQFVSHHMRQVLTSSRPDGQANYLDFKLFEATIPHRHVPLKEGQKRRYLQRGLHYGLVVTDVEAGHERFNHFPVVRLTCTVVEDFIQTKYEVENDLYRNLMRNYVSTFGTIYDPKSAPATGGSNTNPSEVEGSAQEIWSVYRTEAGRE